MSPLFKHTSHRLDSDTNGRPAGTVERKFQKYTNPTGQRAIVFVKSFSVGGMELVELDFIFTTGISWIAPLSF